MPKPLTRVFASAPILGRAIVKTDVAVPLGLLVNEFVNNSIKYAFDGGPGVISVQLVPTGNDRMA